MLVFSENKTTDMIVLKPLSTETGCNEYSGIGRKSAINQLKTQPPWAYCEVPGDIVVRIRSEGGG